MDIDFNNIWIPDKIKNGRVDILNKIKGSTKIIKQSVLDEYNVNSISQKLENTKLIIILRLLEWKLNKDILVDLQDINLLKNLLKNMHLFLPDNNCIPSCIFTL